MSDEAERVVVEPPIEEQMALFVDRHLIGPTLDVDLLLSPPGTPRAFRVRNSCSFS